jgi:8-oxo-dGTP pyrophosphatase MutT (NUDIX family)
MVLDVLAYALGVAVVEQAGAIVVSDRGGVPCILLVTARRNPAHWVFPKGHVDPGETIEQTALREAKEEAGIVGRIVRRAGTLEFPLGDTVLRVHYFIVSTEDEGRAEEGRRFGWFTYEDALKALSFENSRALLRSVWPV